MTKKAKTEEAAENAFNKYSSWADVPENIRGKGPEMLHQSMFPETYDKEIIDELPLCLRVMPHHQNTSGFFITIIEKIRAFDETSSSIADQIHQTAQNGSRIIQEIGGDKEFSFQRCDPQDPDIVYLKAYYGLADDFPYD